MSKVTSKLQVTIPKAVASVYGIEPGDEVEFQPAGEVIRVLVGGALVRPGQLADVAARLDLFDQASRRIQARGATPASQAGRGWTREELYDRGLPR